MFGMDNRVYKRRPKKPFEISSKPPYVSLQSYSRTFKLQRNIKENKKRKGAFGLIVLVLICCFLFIKGKRFVDYENEQSKLIQTQEKVNNDNAFQFLMKSGISRLKDNNTLGAYSEFKLAYKIYPNNTQLKQLIIETANILCSQDEQYCKDLELYLNIE